eukprot:TRINITY_DN223_c0_g1_i3.p1 TRINITY_DN223_c0_g1~~TRINITY_DN223_c0_g1_i3.p1  ORF type:complete len:107 (-),score=7.92 TRINITY_DN223_c0_g1_i3:321-641(-)
MVPNYDYALDVILDAESDEALTEEQQESIETAAEILYGLIHSRYILTSRGLQQMVEKYSNYDFGRCPSVYCQGQAVLPVGQSGTKQKLKAFLYIALLICLFKTCRG